PFSTWTRGLAWAILGYAEQLEFLEFFTRLNEAKMRELTGESSGPFSALVSRLYQIQLKSKGAYKESLEAVKRDNMLTTVGSALMLRAATATADFYLANTCTDGIPMWDTGAPNLHRLGNYLSKPSDPYNKWEPVDSSAAP